MFSTLLLEKPILARDLFGLSILGLRILPPLLVPPIANGLLLGHLCLTITLGSLPLRGVAFFLCLCNIERDFLDISEIIFSNLGCKLAVGKVLLGVWNRELVLSKLFG